MGETLHSRGLMLCPRMLLEAWRSKGVNTEKGLNRGTGLATGKVSTE